MDPSAKRYLWWGGTAFVLLIALLFGDSCGEPRRPRAVKLYENRMRYLATRLGAAAQPRGS